jgi:hypothetical protein
MLSGNPFSFPCDLVTYTACSYFECAALADSLTLRSSIIVERIVGNFHLGDWRLIGEGERALSENIASD